MNLRTRFWLLTGLRWLPTGFLVPVVALLPLDRGLSLAQLGGITAVQGIVVLCLELPTGGFADAMGRKPVFLTSAVFALGSYVVFAAAQSIEVFVAAKVLSGVFRALDSGPLNAWFVDETNATGQEPNVARGISGAGTVIGLSIAGGAVLAGGFVAWDPISSIDALAGPVWLAAAFAFVQIVVTVLLMNEDRSVRTGRLAESIRATPRTILEGARLLWRSRVLRALVAVELFWGFGMVGFETFMPVRFSELLSQPDRAGALMGPVTAGAWGVSALGAACVPLLLRHWSMVSVSIALRLVQGATVVVMGLVAGPVGLIVAFLATYAVHNAAGAIYETMLHQQVDSFHRATVLSLASMAMQPAGSAGAIVLGAIAAGATTGVALVVAGIVLALAAPLFLVKQPMGADEADPGAERPHRRAAG